MKRIGGRGYKPRKVGDRVEHFKYVAIVLVYRNVKDLEECIDSIYRRIPDSKIIVVNAFHDEESKRRIQKAAENGGCIFINIENKGYSYGNNRGIEYARENFSFEYIIISNPDITVGKFDSDMISRHPEYGIIAPRIIAASGRYQNPMGVIRNRLSERLEFIGFEKNNKFLLMAGIGINKLIRKAVVTIHRFDKRPYRIYEAHGSFVIMSNIAIDALYPVYDENLFLFAEEGVLAYKAKKADIKTGQFDEIVIYHKEDGSMKLSNLSLNDEMKKANLYFYKKYVAGS